jgi:glutaredoxin
MNKTSLIIIFSVIILVLGAFLWKEKNENHQLIELILSIIEGKTIYFYGEGCPHCAKVEEFLKENKVESKFQFVKKEVYNEKINAELLFLVAQRKCNLSMNQIGVPFLWSGSDCIIGDEPVIKFFKEKISSE